MPKGHACTSLCREKGSSKDEKQDGADDEKSNKVNARTSSKNNEDDKLCALENGFAFNWNMKVRRFDIVKV